MGSPGVMMESASNLTGGVMVLRTAPMMSRSAHYAPAQIGIGSVMTENVFFKHGSVMVFQIVGISRMKRGITANVPVPDVPVPDVQLKKIMTWQNQNSFNQVVFEFLPIIFEF